jgi:Protein of unknown function (DUF1631)
MESSGPLLTGALAAPYRAVIGEALDSGSAIMQSLIRATRRALLESLARAPAPALHESLAAARDALDQHADRLLERYPQALLTAFRSQAKLGAERVPVVQFEQLERMDEAQVQDRVMLARATLLVLSAVQRRLSVFTPLIAAAAAHPLAPIDHNPVGPALFVQALHSVMLELPLAKPVCDELMRQMTVPLGMALELLYARLSTQLQRQPVELQPAPIATRANPAPSLRPTTRVAHASLTLSRLRQLLAGERVQDTDGRASSLAVFSAQFSREFDTAHGPSGATAFEATVPAAFLALEEMQQVDRVIERIGQRVAAVPSADQASNPALEAIRTSLRHSARGLDQSLSLEVVTLMVDQIASDPRLLGPVQEIIRTLEPALLRLALDDPRFFIDQQHPARRLLDEIAQRSLAYPTVGARGFSQFLAPLTRLIGPGASQPMADAAAFERVLQTLVRDWDAGLPAQALGDAVQALERAEARNLLAEAMAAEIAAKPDIDKVPAGVAEFLCGPWAQVMAHARLAAGPQADDPGRYQELVLALLWSAQPELTRSKVAKLTRLVPKLLAKLREGLALIDYPTMRTSQFFELLMNLHQQAFKSPTTVLPPLWAASTSAGVDAIDPWLAPDEAKASGFMDLRVQPGPTMPPPVPRSAHAGGSPASAAISALMEGPEAGLAEVSLPLGAWVELRGNQGWVRSQLSWASPHGSLFLFTSVSGNTQSMTRRARDKLLQAGDMRVISGQPAVQRALDAVVQTAMLNSVDLAL